MIPGRTKRLGDLFPAQALRPTGQKPRIGFSQAVFAYHPGHPLHPDTAVWTRDPAWRIDKKHLVTPHRDKLEASLGQPIVTRPSLPAARALRPAVRARLYLNLKCRNRGAFNPAHRSVNKRFEFLDSIEDSLDLHPVPFALIDGGFATSIFSESGQDALPPQNNLPLLLQIPYGFTHKFS
jgi:hypothetical protein